MGFLKNQLLERAITKCNFEGCNNIAEVSITDSETEQEVMICFECDDALEWNR